MLKLLGFNYLIRSGHSTAIIVLDHNEEITARPSAVTKIIFIVTPERFLDTGSPIEALGNAITGGA
jgi:hypothetical protein